MPAQEGLFTQDDVLKYQDENEGRESAFIPISLVRGVVMNKVAIGFAVITLAATASTQLYAREFKHSGCADAAEMKFPNDRVARKEFKHWCKDQWKIYKASHP